MSALEDIQRSFQTALLSGDSSSLAAQIKDRAIARIGIYQDAYRIRLREALASNYPQLKQLIGMDAFDSIADGYIDSHRSMHPSIRWFGGDLATVLAESVPAQPWIAEFAAWEWALNSAFDAADATAVSAAQFAHFAPHQWPTLRFTFHPSVQCLAFHTNAPQLHKALTEGHPAPAPTRMDTLWWVCWRHELTPNYRSLASDESDALRAVLANGTFEDMCSALDAHHGHEQAAARAAEVLQQWLGARMICAVHAS